YAIKKENKFLVLETVRKQSPISRADIANVTTLNKGTVSSLVSELINEKMITESGPGKSSGGRRPVILNFNNKSGYCIGIDLGVNYVLGLLTDLEGNIIIEKYIDYTYSTYNETVKLLYTVINYLIYSKPSSPYGIIGIGIGVPGAINHACDILFAPNLQWENIQIKQLFENHYQVPVIIENEANAGAYGEKKYGIGQTQQNIIYVSIGIGIGVGMIFNGELYKGNNGFSGELGHMTIETNGKKCSCGNNGCWELYASEQSLANDMKLLNIPPPSEGQQYLDYLLQLAENGNSESIKLFHQIGDYIGLGLNNIVNIFNPEQIIIGNRIAFAAKWVENSLMRRINNTFWFQKKDLTINFSKLSTHSSALGMSAFSVDRFLESY